MGHRRDAVEALRSHAHDLHSDVVVRGGGTVRVGSPHQDDGRRTETGLGAPQLRALVAVAAVVLVGLVGIVGALEQALAPPRENGPFTPGKGGGS